MHISLLGRSERASGSKTMGRIQSLGPLLTMTVLAELEETWHDPPCHVGPLSFQDKDSMERVERDSHLSSWEGGWQRLSRDDERRSLAVCSKAACR